MSEGRVYWSGTLSPVAPLIAAPRDSWDSLSPGQEVIIVGWREKLSLGIMRERRNFLALESDRLDLSLGRS